MGNSRRMALGSKAPPEVREGSSWNSGAGAAISFLEGASQYGAAPSSGECGPPSSSGSGATWRSLFDPSASKRSGWENGDSGSGRSTGADEGAAAAVGDEPVGEAPVGEAPVGEAPVGEAPVGE